jgi:hypothetical protein
LIKSFRYPTLRMMKPVFMILWFVMAFAKASYGHELPMFGAVPKLSDEWRVRERETDVPRFAGTWHIASLVLTNSRTGDFLSFCEEKKVEGAPFSKVNRVPWSDGAADRFPGGYTRLHRPEEYKPRVYWVRNEVVDIGVVDTNRNTNFVEQALEYTLIFEDQNGSPARLAHGYVIPMGHFRILVQHTSTSVITSDLAHTMISTMLWDYVNRQKAADATDSAEESKAAEDEPAVLKIKVPGKVPAVLWSVQRELCLIRIDFPSVLNDAEFPKHPVTQVWLLKADGTAIAPDKSFATPIWSSGGYKTASFVHTFPKAAATHAIGVVVRIDGELFVEQLRPDASEESLSGMAPKTTAEPAGKVHIGKWDHGAVPGPPEGFPPRMERGSSNRSPDETRE